MTSTATAVAPTEARVYRVVLLTVLGAAWGADLFKDISDPWLTTFRFLLMTAGTSALVWELTSQARRRAVDAAHRWTGTDTANAAILGVFSALLITARTFGHTPEHQRTSAIAFASLFLALAAYFVLLRRRALK
jgi:hypothetical protein